MLQKKIQTYLKNCSITPSPFNGLGSIGVLCATNLGLIALLGGLMMFLSGRMEIFLLTLIMVIAAGSMVSLLLFKLQHLKNIAQQQQIESDGYKVMQTALLIVTPGLQFCYGNKKAQETCWWADNFPLFRNMLFSKESKDALERLIESLYGQEEGVEILHLKSERRVEIWRIHSVPLEKNSLWQCYNITQEEDEKSQYLSQIKNLSLFLDYAVEGLFSFNEKGTVLFCNEKFSNWLGYSREEVIGAPISKFLSKPRTQDPAKLSEIQGKYDFITSSSRIKSGFLEQMQIPCENGFTTYSRVSFHALFANESDLNKVLEMTPLPVICLDENGHIRDSNILFREKFGHESKLLQDTPFLNLIADFQKEEIKNTLTALINEREEGKSLEIHFNDSRESIVSAYFAPLPLKNQKGFFVQFHDITDQKRFETQLVQSQKMQAVGQLAGGIAHDFNNLLTAMIGFCDLMLLRHTPGDHSFTDVMQIKQNANRAANLVRQLLAFSRQQTLQPKVLNITECLAELSALLRRLIGSNLDLKIKYIRDLWLVLVDEGQFEQMIINLVVNARDAMEEGRGGTISISTQNYELKKAKRYGHDVIPVGSYILVEVTDTGVGIKPEDLDRIFDPFFTTKQLGSGTGLGLSTVYGIIKQTGGFIHVESKLGEGTTFTIYLPRYVADENQIIESQKKEKTQPQDLTGSSTILIVEDEDAVRLFSARALRSKGYKVIEAINGEAALELMKTNNEKIDLVISDVIMPHMDGPTFINELSKLHVKPKVLFISGYTEDTFQKRLKEETQVQFLGKPFSLTDLAIRVKEILSEDDASPLKDAS
jgi:two-component system cell cycle sensor histidine kinase/response regulator CckA